VPESPLGLRTRRPFELQLLEIAMGGRKTLEKYWKEHGESFDISEQVICLEILGEFKQFEKNGSIDTVVDRARNQVVKMKGNKNLHHRALLVYRYYLNLSMSCERADYGNQTRREDLGASENRERESKDYSRSSQLLTIDERLDLMIGVELPEVQEEGSSNEQESCTNTQQGEPSGSSCEVVTPFDDNMSCEALSIFERPIETEDFSTSCHGLGITRGKSLAESSLGAEKSEERGSMINVARNSPTLRQKDVNLDDVELKIDSEGETPKKVCESFPEKDFKYPIEWKVDGITYKATSLSDLRRNHDIELEGFFRKRGGSCHIWRNYYGFFLETGVLLYFRKKTFKRVVDFRKSIPAILKSKKFKLNIRGLYVNSKVSDWLIQFANEKKLNTWYETILKFSHSRDNDGLEQLLGPPKKV